MKKIFFIVFVILYFSIGFLSAQSYGGYVLYAVQNSNKAYLIDNSGNVYHSWSFSSSAKTCYSTYLMPEQILWRSVARSGNQLTGAAICGQVQKVDWNGNILWDYVYSSSTYVSHHDICPMPNGNVLLICYDVRTATAASQAGCSQNITIWSEKIVEIQPT